VELSVKCLGFEVPDEFVIDYGKDFAGTYRNLLDIRVLTRDGG
jgi:hypoxanthine phosphoribosyltransferase